MERWTGDEEPCQVCEAPTDRRTSVSEQEDGDWFTMTWTLCEKHDTAEYLPAES